MKKTIIISLACFIILSTAGVIYLNNVVLPKTAKSLIVKAIEDATQKKVALGSLRINILKGLVLKDLNVYDGDKKIVSVKEASCIFWVWGLMQKKIVIPKITLKSARVFLERRKDNSFNLAEIFLFQQDSLVQPKPIQAAAEASTEVKRPSGFILEVYRVNIIDSIINFKDSSLAVPFSQDLNNVDINIYLSLPNSLRFKASAKMQDSPNPNIALTGEFKFPQEELTANVSMKNIPLNKFSAYYQSLGIGVKEGSADASIFLKLKDHVLNLDCQVDALRINGNKDNILFNLKIKAEASIKYGPNKGGLQYSGKAFFTDSAISGVGFVESINEIKAAVSFDNGEYGFSGINASMEVISAFLKLNKVQDPVEEIQGRLEFTPGRLETKGLNFKYQKIPYKLSLLVSNFQTPDIGWELTSEGLLIKSNFTLDKSKVNLSNISGRYLDSDFKAAGSFDTLSSRANILGVCAINLEDLSKPLIKFKDQLDKISPKGKVQVKFNLSGDIKDLKGCEIEAWVSGPRVSLYSLKGDNVFGYYAQQAGVVDIPFLNFSFYSGQVDISAKANLRPDSLPYSLNLNMQGVKIEELKLDTEAKDKDVAGIINGGFNLNGFFNDWATVSGAGSLDITKGKLWELDLFKGMGKLLFARDFAYMIFQEGSCNFSVQDKYIFTNNLMLKSNKAYLSGKVKLGFDSSIDAVLNIDIIDELIPLSGTLKDVTTTVLGKSGKFATIGITGTLKEPKYKLHPVVENIIKGLTDALKQAIRKKQAAD